MNWGVPVVATAGAGPDGTVWSMSYSTDGRALLAPVSKAPGKRVTGASVAEQRASYEREPQVAILPEFRSWWAHERLLACLCWLPMPGGRLARQDSEVVILRVAHLRSSAYEEQQATRRGTTGVGHCLARDPRCCRATPLPRDLVP
jgi:hypothetical protein